MLAYFLRFELVDTINIGFYRSGDNIRIRSKSIINLIIILHLHMQVEYDNQIYYGFGANTDIIAASVEAYIDCINKFKS